VSLEAGALCYVDTSALIERYVRESDGDDFDGFSQEPGYDRASCALQTVEFTSTLQRRLRLGAMNHRHIAGARQRLFANLAAGGRRSSAFEADVLSRATSLLTDLGVAVATLDALPVACALQSNAGHFATTDRQIAAAARKTGLTVQLF